MKGCNGFCFLTSLMNIYLNIQQHTKDTNQLTKTYTLDVARDDSFSLFNEMFSIFQLWHD